jgi:hypothetical protein
MRARDPLRRLVRLLGGVLVIAVLLAAAYLLFAPRTRAAPQQPIEFNHQLMVGFGIQCVYCHSGVTKSPTASIPSVQKCMGCHNVVATDKAGVKELAGYWERGEPIPWARVYQVPRFVYFPHHVHVAAGLNCERCHGNVGQMQETHRVVDMNMGWCLGCHVDQPNGQQLKDCALCHR